MSASPRSYRSRPSGQRCRGTGPDCGSCHDRPDQVGEALLHHLAAGHTDQRCQGVHRSTEAHDRGRLVVRGGSHRGRPRGHRLQLLQARRRSGPVRARPGDRSGSDRRGSERHRQDLDETGLGGRLRRTQWAVHAVDRRVRRRIMGPQGQAREPATGQTARLPSGLGPHLQHLRRVPARTDRAGRSRIPLTPCPAASAASRSRSVNRTGRPTSPASSAFGNIWVMTFR